MAKHVRATSRAERITGLSILVVLAIVAAGVALKQSRYNPDIFRISVPASAPAAPALSGFAPQAFSPLSAPESFDPDNLFDKIDGKADLYLSAGFVGLRCQRFAVSGNPDEWFELFIYDMGTAPHAFSVFSLQRRAEAQPLDLTEYAYRTKNAVYLARGTHYVEIVGAVVSDRVTDALVAVAREFVQTVPAAERLLELALFPVENLRDDSFTLQVADAFGFDGFKDVFTARYDLDGKDVTAFLVVAGTPAEAGRLAEAYRQFLLSNGGRELGDGRVELLGNVEIVFARDRFVAGVHAAPNRQVADQLAVMLDHQLAEAAK